MASGSHYSGEDRAGFLRHFSDHEYSLLAGNVGLSVQTVWNWDFVNPNAQTAAKLQMDILSTQTSLTVTGPYNGSESPWVNPTVGASLGTQVFKGTTYQHFQVTWSTGQGWDGHVPGGPGPSPGASGQVAGGASFHIGTGFNGVNFNAADPIIVTNVTLLDGSGAALALHPRVVAFDSGTLDAADGSFAIRAINIEGLPLRLESVRVMLLPRLLAIDQMVNDQRKLLDVRGTPFNQWGEARTVKLAKTLERGQTLAIPIARMSDKRHVVEFRKESDCAAEDRLTGRDVMNCRPGYSVDLFPATTVYVSAIAVDPASKHWDFKAKRYVQGPVTSHAFLQITGRHPDLNKNGVDDYIDVARGKSKDSNHDGVPDDVQRPR
jgi:hypothetical protein